MDDPAALVRRWCRRRDETAFGEFYRAHAERLWRFLVARGVEPESAYDVVADAFERWLKSVCRDPRAPVALLYRIALNRATDLFRRRRVREPAAPADPEALAAAPDDRGLVHDVEHLLGGLSHDEQNLLLLRYWVGLTHRETASVVGRPEGTVRRETAGILHRLRAGLDDD
ncbi:MAG: RNA polymerase sigma factor [Halofilum sp. (in: g-proteobacteria)]|nr:RNA polymerase sigma factor [Halofilum sp. (in: g-proteobacteria)]